MCRFKNFSRGIFSFLASALSLKNISITEFRVSL